MSDENHPKSILIVAHEPDLTGIINDVLSGDSRFCTRQANTFYEALDKIVTGDLSLVIVENRLGDMTGIDLLTAVARLAPELPVIIIDRQLSARAALSAFRLGAADYIAQPFQPDMLLMQIIRILHDEPRLAEGVDDKSFYETNELPREQDVVDTIPTRDLGFTLNQQQSMAITRQLMQFHTQVRASFAGLLNGGGEIIASAGSLKDEDKNLVKSALTQDKAKRLAHVLSEQRFNANYLEGESYNVYMVEFGDKMKLSLVTICESSVKSGVVLFFAKQLAEDINNIIHKHEVVPG